MDKGTHGVFIVLALYIAFVFAPYLALWAIHVTVLCAVEAANGEIGGFTGYGRD